MSRRKDFNSFPDWSCGEPLKTQHLQVDFTPLEEVDTDFVQEKCCAFWELISNSPELKDLMVLPELTQYNKHIRSPSIQAESTPSESLALSERITGERTALSVLEFAEENGMVDDTFVPRLPATCVQEEREYPDTEPTAALFSFSRSHASKHTCCKCGCCELENEKQAKGGRTAPEAQRLCNMMRVWDQDHPRSMEPPGRVPLLSHCLMQRNIIS